MRFFICKLQSAIGGKQVDRKFPSLARWRTTMGFRVEKLTTCSYLQRLQQQIPCEKRLDSEPVRATRR